MSVRIGHAGIAETGGVRGQPGDQTGREVCVRSWYDGGWTFAAIHPDAAVRERHARAVEAACANDCIGYSQDGRNTLYREAKAVDMDIGRIRTPCSCDCSSLQNCAAVASGAPGVSYGSNGWVTGSMEKNLRAAGYAILKDKSLLRSEACCVRGAVYVSAGHSVCALDDGGRAAETLRAAGLSPDDGADAGSAPEQRDARLPVLREGDRSEAVRALQLLLRAKGFSLGAAGADGDFGPQTKRALLGFQRRGRLGEEGFAGAKTWEALICR